MAMSPLPGATTSEPGYIATPAGHAGEVTPDASLDQLFALLGHEGRRAVIDHLARFAPGGVASISELVVATGLSRFSVSRFVKALHEAGLVERTKVGNRVTVHLILEPLRRVDDWVWAVIDRVNSEGETTH